MSRQLLLESWPRTPEGQIMLIGTDRALLYAALVWDDAPLCRDLQCELQRLRLKYEALKGQPPLNLGDLSDLAFAIQFVREALEETEDLQARARNFVAQ